MSPWLLAEFLELVHQGSLRAHVGRHGRLAWVTRNSAILQINTVTQA